MFPEPWLLSMRSVHPRFQILPTDIRGLDPGHGTKMASIAGGKSFGVVPNADLFLVKYKGHYNKGPTRGLNNQDIPSNDAALKVQPVALFFCLGKIRGHIEKRLKIDPNAKSVINMSWGKTQHPQCLFIVVHTS